MITGVKPETYQNKADFSFLKSKKIVYLVNVDWFFLSHRLPLALAARDAGAEVIVAAGDTGKGQRLEEEGIHFVPLPFSRQGTNLFQEIRTIRAIGSFLKKTKPDLLHTVSIKPVLYGSLLSSFIGDWPVVNAVSGLGYVFSKDRKAKLVRKGLKRIYREALSNPKSITIFQNPSDMETMVSEGLIDHKQTTLIRGSGVNCNIYKPTPFPRKPVVMLASRMLWDKGVGEFVEAAKILNPKYPDVKFVLVGAADDENPRAISQKQINRWQNEHIFIEWWGAKEPSEMPDILSKATIITLPSYHEGLPKVLLEAAAAGRPIVASEIPGCMEVVKDNFNGFLVNPKDSSMLAEKISFLLDNFSMIKRFGENGRDSICNNFEEEIITRKTFQIYRSLL